MFDQAIAPAISAGLGAIALRGKIRSISEASGVVAGQGVTPTLTPGESGQNATKSKPLAKGSDKKVPNESGSTHDLPNGSEGKGGFAQSVTSAFKPKTYPSAIGATTGVTPSVPTTPQP